MAFFAAYIAMFVVMILAMLGMSLVMLSLAFIRVTITIVVLSCIGWWALVNHSLVDNFVGLGLLHFSAFVLIGHIAGRATLAGDPKATKSRLRRRIFLVGTGWAIVAGVLTYFAISIQATELAEQARTLSDQATLEDNPQLAQIRRILPYMALFSAFAGFLQFCLYAWVNAMIWTRVHFRVAG